MRAAVSEPRETKKENEDVANPSVSTGKTDVGR